MRPRLPIRRTLPLRPFKPPNYPRPFTRNTLTSHSRPQVPFLSTPSRRPNARFLTTETKEWIKDEVWKAGKYTVVLWTGSFLLLMLAFGLQEEYLNHRFPSPSEWSWVTRKDFRTAQWNESDGEDGVDLVDWAKTGDMYRRLLRRLENPSIDGAGLKSTAEGGILVAGIGKTGYDISEKPEPWRRGYYEILMGAARAAEHLDGYVRDKVRNIAFPANVVIGPSNPNPRPVSPFSKSPPKEEDCEQAFESPEVYYMRILTTQGFTEKQRIDAALAYGVWLDYKGIHEAALEMHRWAADIANASSQAYKPAIDPATGVIGADPGVPSANILSVATALGVHHAVNSNLTLALPIFLSVLRARKSLPEVPATMQQTVSPDLEDNNLFKTITTTIRSIVTPPEYPPPPDDGTTPPLRTPKERCEEAGIMTYIGEILYASKQTRTSREDGLAWTREAVDLAEEELRRNAVDKEGRKKCKECLEVGIGNWMAMVGAMARDEKEKKSSGGGWLGFGKEQKDIGRWESEEKVVFERMRRAKDILEPGAGPKAAPSGGVLSV